MRLVLRISNALFFFLYNRNLVGYDTVLDIYCAAYRRVHGRADFDEFCAGVRAFNARRRYARMQSRAAARPYLH